ncbi:MULTISPECIES: hypothetical protein [Micromonospora]|uniref:hypothetical protein n=1 Tax=Micromonospora TaxID=1873 RepID=UPI0001BF1707|nr:MULTISPECIES: hypothetical protein [Micromonospora]ADL49536.1 hypothetical protein Micau_6036 [Micromonospora aurantiaca ATCC 27029]
MTVSMFDAVRNGEARQGHADGRPGFVDRRGRVVSTAVWQRLSERPDYTLVALDHAVSQGGPVQVHTFWLGVAGPDELISRTVTSDGHALLGWGWRCEADAREGHAAVCAWLCGETEQPAGLLRAPAGATLVEHPEKRLSRCRSTWECGRRHRRLFRCAGHRPSAEDLVRS